MWALCFLLLRRLSSEVIQECVCLYKPMSSMLVLGVSPFQLWVPWCNPTCYWRLHSCYSWRYFSVLRVPLWCRWCWLSSTERCISSLVLVDLCVLQSLGVLHVHHGCCFTVVVWSCIDWVVQGVMLVADPRCWYINYLLQVKVFGNLHVSVVYLPSCLWTVDGIFYPVDVW